jgi:hypothetical protein
MMGGLLLWTARGHLWNVVRAACLPQAPGRDLAEYEPFSPRLMLLGWLCSSGGLLGWCHFSGINWLPAVAFLAVYGLTSLVLARVVVEGGFLFPQTTFMPLEMLTGSLMSTGAIGAASLTRLSFLQPVLFYDMRTNLLPGFLHTLKMAHELKLTPRDVRRLMMAVALAIAISWMVSTTMTLATIYKVGGLSTYKWFTQIGPQGIFKGTATMLNRQPGVTVMNWGWLTVGAGIVWGLTFMRARFLWFPLHPLAYLMAGSFPIIKLWPSFFVGWAFKTAILHYGGYELSQKFRPFMLGLILGNAGAMVLWMIFGFFKGSQISYWPA